MFMVSLTSESLEKPLQFLLKKLHYELHSKEELEDTAYFVRKKSNYSRHRTNITKTIPLLKFFDL